MYVYRLDYPVLMCKDKDKDKYRDKRLKTPNIFYILKSRGFKDFKYVILTSQPVNFELVDQTRPE